VHERELPGARVPSPTTSDGSGNSCKDGGVPNTIEIKCETRRLVHGGCGPADQPLNTYEAFILFVFFSAFRAYLSRYYHTQSVNEDWEYMY